MADEDKPLPATDRQVEKFREDGQVAVSRELLAALSLSVGVLGLYYLLPQFSLGVLQFLIYDRSRMVRGELDIPELLSLGQLGMTTVGVPMLLVLVGSTAVAILSGLVMTGFNFTWKAATPNLDRLDVMQNAQQNFFSAMPFVGLLKGTLISILLAWSVWSTVQGRIPDIMVLASRPLEGQVEFIKNLTALVLEHTMPIALAIGALDFVYQRWQLDQRMMMSVQEVRDEHKDSEGDPQVKAKRRARQRQLSARQSLAKIAQADVVVTNPTHYAVALRYRRQENAAPVVIARGVDHLALQIRQEAMRQDVMIIENRPLARALYAKAKVGAAIPSEFYAPVAEVLAVVYRRRRRKPA
jgi:flagellar biosynthetic protein FlhB